MNIEFTIGDFLQGFLEDYELSQIKLAKLINVDSSRINLIINNKRNISVDTDFRLCKLFGLSEGYFLRVQEEIERKKLKIQKAIDFETIIPLKKCLLSKAG
ncbi:MAG: HigA family addiction module antitoxin [Alphaproteobacteria bacterium]|nr:HigA family addiction module antitoxin [Alphaproteobacteria bacterium]